MDEFHSHTDGPLSPEAKRALVARLLRERAAAVRQAPAAAAGHRAVPASGHSEPDHGAVRPVDRSAAWPLSFAQQRFCLLEQLSTEPGLCNLPFSLRLTGTLSVERLERAFALLIERHLAFRTRFETVDGELRQSIGAPFTVPIAVVDLGGLSDRERQAETERQVLEESRRPFDLESGQLLRILLIRMRDDEHLLHVTTHHAVADGWSAVIVLRELPVLYDAAAHGVAAVSLPVLPIQYVDYAAWQHARAGGPDAARDLAYWTDHLAGAPPVLDLPTDAPRPVAQTFRGAAHLSQLPPSLTAALKAFSRQRSVTPFMTLLSAFAVLMFRHTGQTDLVIGTPVAGRDRPEVEPIIGCFINSLALRIEIDPAASFDALLEHVRTTALDAYAHQDVPFERVIEAVHPRRDLARTPVFQVMFNMLGFHDAWRSQAADVAFEAVSPAEEPSKFDLTFYIYGSNDLTLRVLYNANLFARDRMVDLLEQMRCLVEQVVVDPAQPVTHYSLITTAARALLPDPTRPLPVPAEETIWDRVRAVAASDPGRLAIEDASGSWTYADVDRVSDDVARRLEASGIGGEQVVAVHAIRAASLAAAALGVWKAGAACLLLDARYPPARNAAYLEAARPTAWIDLGPEGALDPELARRAPTVVIRVEPSARGAGPRPADQTDLDRLAYIAFTSGSTGTPKGVCGSHRPLAHFLRWHADTFGFHRDDRFSLLSGLSHDPAWRDLFAPLWVGASLHVPPEDAFDAPSALAAWAARAGITVAHLTPPVARMLAAGAAGGDPLRLRHAFVGGDALDTTAVRRLHAAAPGVRVTSFYGATETPQAMGVFTADDPLWTSPDSPVRRVPLGRGIDGVQLLVLNAAGQLAGLGERGEIVVRTPYLTRGYLEQTGDGRFAVNPFTEAAGDRVYRTGDLGRYLPTGDVEFAGRADLQVKLRGIRVELAEVEAALGACPGVGQAAVRVHEPGTDDAMLVGYVTAAGELPDPAAIRADLASRFPPAMVPTSVVVLDQMPLTANGKVDRLRLPAIDARAEAARPAFVAASTAVEQALAEIWSTLLGVSPIGVADDFFDLGGHSLLATRMVSRIRAGLGVHVPLRALFDAPTVGALARHIEALQWMRAAQAEPTAGITEIEL